MNIDKALEVLEERKVVELRIAGRADTPDQRSYAVREINFYESVAEVVRFGQVIVVDADHGKSCECSQCEPFKNLVRAVEGLR